MTQDAVLAEIARDMVRIGCRLVIALMALIAVCIGQLVIPVPMARLAGQSDVFSGEGKTRRVMIKGGGLPCRCGVACLTCMRESTRHVVWLLRAGKILRMARITIRGQRGELVVDVARGTDDRLVRAGQRESRQIMVESAPPGHGRERVTSGAIDREGRRRVARTHSCLERIAMARDTGERRSHVPLRRRFRVAFVAVDNRVPAHEREAGLLMLLLHVRDEPGVHGMASETVRAQFLLVDIPMAAVAVSADLREDKPVVTGGAFDAGVPPDERKAGGGMIEGGILPHRPGVGGMAVAAGGRQCAVRRILRESKVDEENGQQEQFLHCSILLVVWHDSQADAIGLNRMNEPAVSATRGWQPAHGTFVWAPVSENVL